MGTIEALPEVDIEELLRTAIVGRIACCDHGKSGGDGRPYVVPLAYGYDGRAIYAHSAVGRKIRMMRSNPLMTVEVDEATAPDRWRSVIAEGTYEELTEPLDRDLALGIIYPLPESRPVLGAEIVVYRIVLTAKSGRFERPATETPIGWDL